VREIRLEECHLLSMHLSLLSPPFAIAVSIKKWMEGERERERARARSLTEQRRRGRSSALLVAMAKVEVGEVGPYIAGGGGHVAGRGRGTWAQVSGNGKTWRRGPESNRREPGRQVADLCVRGLGELDGRINLAFAPAGAVTQKRAKERKCLTFDYAAD
jgi:hypothetical protein